ncbi:hypothetical protein ZIOFF_006810 [Zingiber officinale]|uniref:FAD/NAD(P)-binding domain-containing protein n=1 Tax=Zingiber officinale TaxID=94328 RepID=A0A8J5ICJ1_ZINOF|nr:hypothetical protein ZIOFF_006810 [Zingiber officinale]
MGDGGAMAIEVMKIEQSCVENKQPGAASSSSMSEGSYGFSGMSPSVCSSSRSSPSHSFSFLSVCVCSGGGIIAYADAKSDHNSDAPGATNKKKLVVLGTGWVGTSFLRNVDTSQYDVKVVSPRNYFLFTPLLPSVTCGTVEPRSIAEPIRNIMRKKGEQIQFWEAECHKIDPVNKKILCRSNICTNSEGKGEFAVDYDYLVVALGAKPNTFNTPGVVEKSGCRMLFELLVLTGAQVGMDWTTILKKRNEFRVAFAEFDTESVSKFTEKQMVSISVELKLDLGRVRGISLSTLK